MIRRIIWKVGQLMGLLLRSVYYRVGAILIGYRLGSGCRIYGRIRFGSAGRGIEIGHRCMLGADLFFSVSRDARLVIGDGVSINTGGHLVACERIEIGEGTAIGEYVSIRDQNHRFGAGGSPVSTQGYSSAPITIGRNVWIGRGCFIGPGVDIGDGAVIGANSVVTKSIPAMTVAVGSPAKAIRSLKGETTA